MGGILMLIYSDEQGDILLVVMTKTVAGEPHITPSVYAEVLEIDPATNQHIVNHIDVDYTLVSLLDGVLSYDGNIIVINPPGAEWLEEIIEEQSEDDVIAIPGWSTWTEEQALAWYTTNVIDLIDAIPDINGLSPTAYANNAQAIAAQMQDICNAQALVILNLARMVIAMRNKLWPNLEGS